MAAKHPCQVSPINHAFAPTPSERAEAEAIIELFASNPSVAVVNHGGVAIDRTGLEKAEHTLQLCGA